MENDDFNFSAAVRRLVEQFNQLPVEDKEVFLRLIREGADNELLRLADLN
jgi:hypothetical protein